MMRIARELDIENMVGFFEIKMAGGFAFRLTEARPRFTPQDLQNLSDVLANSTIYTFNGNHYDLPILVLALHGVDHVALKEAGDAIIVEGLQSWQFYQRYQIEVPAWIDHVDLMEVAPGVRMSLKMYAGRMHAPRMQDLPLSPTVPVPPHHFESISTYCDNDLAVTRLLRYGVSDRLLLRERMSEQYGVDLRSKSDAQIAEAVVKSELPFAPMKRYVSHGFTFKYEAPPYMRFVQPHLGQLLADILAADFTVTDKEEALVIHGDATGIHTGVQIPATLKHRDIPIGKALYRMGIGGLHSQESSVNYTASSGFEIWDIDVKSYYPSLIISLDMAPQQIGPDFLRIYRKIYDERLRNKAISHTSDEARTIADGFKIVLNGVFGKLLSKWSVFYAPELGMRVTVTGQLCLLMLIEMMELCGIQVLSANTDGIVLRVPMHLRDMAKSNVAWWEKLSGLEMEYTNYKSIHLRDVNSYIAITLDGKVKRKGAFGESGLLAGPGGKHPDKDICAEAVVAYLKDGTHPRSTILACTDIRKFLQVRNVKNGGEFDGHYLGKAVRWYYSTDGGQIVDKVSRARVAGSKGCVPIMQLPDAFPIDVAHSVYEAEALEMLADLGLPIDYWQDTGNGRVHPTLRGDDPGLAYAQITRKVYEKQKAL